MRGEGDLNGIGKRSRRYNNIIFWCCCDDVRTRFAASAAGNCARIYLIFFFFGPPFTSMLFSFLRQNAYLYVCARRKISCCWRRRPDINDDARGETFAVTTTTGVTQRTCGERSDILLHCTATFSLSARAISLYIYIYAQLERVPLVIVTTTLYAAI